ncbi:MAG: type I DNA topoisomerase [Bacteroidales bacterium]|nr:type I DNA topoisomerase [Bacteroidales bacterium]
MEENLVIVESPAKAKTIGNFLGKGFRVQSSFGHIRDLSKENYGVDIENNYLPQYIIPDDKKKIVADLKASAKKASIIWLASDEDREGEAIAWHLSEVLKLEPEKTRRIVFHEITRNAINEAIENPRDINQNLVNAQQARRILDRLVGFELSPLLWRKVKPSLSAGRVQSVAVRLIVERENTIDEFQSSSFFRVVAQFEFKDSNGKTHKFQAELPAKLKDQASAKEFLESCRGAGYHVLDVARKPAKKSPAPPFTTSTLQQEASRKLGFSVAQTMSVAQRLYESGKITYMRTDSVNLSKSALAGVRDVIEKEYGKEYSRTRNFSTKSKGAQEAHEAIRPTYLEQKNIEGKRQEQRLYELIWKRTIASQMSEAQLERTTARIGISTRSDHLAATGEVIRFDGFLKVYMESSDEEADEQPRGLLPPIKEKDPLHLIQMEATERFTQSPARFTEASLVKKLEELGIGRPSTYAPTISTIQNRGYVEKGDRTGNERNYMVLTLADDQLRDERKSEVIGKEKSKLFPTDIGGLVNDFLVDYFSNILDYNFTANIEKEFDKIADGELEWTQMISSFYPGFHEQVVQTAQNSKKPTGERILGKDPESGRQVSVRVGRFGPMVQIGEASEEEKPRFAGLLKNQSIKTISLEEALSLFKLPRVIGQFEDEEVSIGVGKFGPYARHSNKFYSLGKSDDPFNITLDRAIDLIHQKREQDKNKIIRKFDENPGLQILNGRWGPYIKLDKENFRIPKNKKAEELSFEECLRIIEKARETKKKKT